MYDEVRVKCPECGSVHYAQSKGGDCLLRTYNLEDAPQDVLSDVNRHPMNCQDCGASFKVEVVSMCRVVKT
jgi:transcription elongation factor Elf1